MSAVWRAARAAVRRRRVEKFTVGLSVLLSTTAAVFALGIIEASTDPFDRAFARTSGAHLVARYDNDAVTREQVQATAKRAGVTAAAGPFDVAEVTVQSADVPEKLEIIGRDDPGGPVGRLVLAEGRWAQKPGEIVLSQRQADSWDIGSQVPTVGSPPLTVVGHATSLMREQSWVTQEQAKALAPTSTQMLYRFAAVDTEAQLSTAAAAVTAGLPDGALPALTSYLLMRESGSFDLFVPFLTTFAVLGLLVAILIIANVIGGAVVAGFRHIGVLKALGFTPGQVIGVYLTMIAVPAGVGCLGGVMLANLLATGLLSLVYGALGVAPTGLALWVNLVALVGVPLVVALAAFVPALRAGRLPARAALSAGGAASTGRGRQVQRWLSGTRLPRPVSLGLSLPFARPARAGLTLAAILLGTMSVAFASGLAETLTRYAHGAARTDFVQLVARTSDEDGNRTATLTDNDVETLLRARPGTKQVTTETVTPGRAIGVGAEFDVHGVHGDVKALGYELLDGRWFTGPGEVVVAPEFLQIWDRSVGDVLTLQTGDSTSSVRIVGEAFLDQPELILTSGPPAGAGRTVTQFSLGLAEGTDTEAYARDIDAAGLGLDVELNDDSNGLALIMTTLVTTLALMLSTVAALGVFSTAVMTTRERSRDLGILKSIGMTPRQVIAPVVTSTAGLGVVGGLLGVPLGVMAHRLVLPMTVEEAKSRLPAAWMDVYDVSLIALLVGGGVMIAVLGTLLPAIWAARTRIANVLHTE